MALNVRPVLSSISAFDADFGTSGKEHLEAPIVKFSWREGVVRKNRLRIVDYDNNTEVYNCIITTMSLTHQLHRNGTSNNEIVSQSCNYGLKNGRKYKACVSVFTTDGVESEASEWIIFYCYSTPSFEFTNFDNMIGTGESRVAVVSGSSINLIVNYNQEEGEKLSSYNFELLDSAGESLFISNTKYSSSETSKVILRHTFGGIDETKQDAYGNINAENAYTVICRGQTQHGMIIEKRQRFIVKLPISGVGSLIKAKTLENGTVVISSNFKIMNTLCSTENPIYVMNEAGKPYAIDLTHGDYVEIVDGFLMKKPFEIIFDGDFIPGKLITLRTMGEPVDGIKKYYYCYVYLKKVEYTIVPYYYFSFYIERDGIIYEIKTDYFRYESDLVSAKVDVSYNENKHYNIKAIIDYHGKNYIVSYHDNDYAYLTLVSDYNIKDDNNGNIEITCNTLEIIDDDNGNIAF